MREIKFRFYDRDKKEMIYQSDNTCSCLNGLEYFCQLVGQVKGYTPEIQQYTGLKDKNGNEIYEGDIIKGKDFNGIELSGVVAFDKGTFCLRSIEKNWNKEREVLSTWKDGCQYWSSLENLNDLEIIGNKFENNN